MTTNRTCVVLRKIGFAILLALVGFACADGVGQMLADAGPSMQNGSVPDVGAQCDRLVNAPCNNVRDGFEVVGLKAARVEVCGFEATGNAGNCLYAGACYTGSTV